MLQPPGNGADEEDGGEPPPSGRPYAWAPETAPTLKTPKMHAKESVVKVSEP